MKKILFFIYLLHLTSCYSQNGTSGLNKKQPIAIKTLTYCDTFKVSIDTNTRFLSKSIAELVDIIEVASKNRLAPKFETKIYKYFDSKKFTFRNDTSNRYIEKVEVICDKQGNIIYIYEKARYNLLYENDWCRVLSVGGFCAKLDSGYVYPKIDESKLKGLTSGGIVIVQDKNTGISVYLRYKSRDSLSEKHDEVDFLEEIGILYDDLMVNHRFKFGYSRINGAVTWYVKYDNKAGLNTPIVSIFTQEKDFTFKCSKKTTLRDLLEQSNNWVKRYCADSTNQTHKYDNFYMKSAYEPAYLRDY